MGMNGLLLDSLQMGVRMTYHFKSLLKYLSYPLHKNPPENANKCYYMHTSFGLKATILPETQNLIQNLLITWKIARKVQELEYCKT